VCVRRIACREKVGDMEGNRFIVQEYYFAISIGLEIIPTLNMYSSI
jgi:hypothetical protein